MSGTVSYTNFDFDAVTVVPVIASFDSEGRIAPLYVRILGNSYKIDSFGERLRYANVTEFNCRIIDRGYIKPLKLTYHAEMGIWTIPAPLDNA